MTKQFSFQEHKQLPSSKKKKKKKKSSEVFIKGECSGANGLQVNNLGFVQQSNIL
jgi:hypothetical protein